jgi:hypothetical protein
MHGTRWLGRLLLMLTVSGAPAAAGPAAAQPPEAAVGTWRLVSAKVNGKPADIPAGTTILKHVTPTDFVFVYYDRQGQVTVAGGGPYRLDGTRYEETVEYGLGEGMQPLLGKTHVFTLRIEGGRWYQEGAERDGTVIEEVWERARAARSP